MKILLTYPPVENVHPWEGPALVNKFVELFQNSTDQRGHALVSAPEEADVILYLEPNCWKDREYAELMLREEYIRRFPAKCFAYNYADFFIGFLPGIYVCIPKTHAADHRFQSWNYVLGLPNPWVEKFASERDSRSPSLLFSFRGSNTAPVRPPLFARAQEWSQFSRIVELDGKHFYKLTEDLQKNYALEILDSAFVLCPRGLGCSSHRLFETMALGRVPVILSDEWVAPVGPAWDTFSIRVEEKDVTRLPEILRPLLAQSTAMGQRARSAWETWFSPACVVPQFFDRLALLAAQQHPERPPRYEKTWRSWGFYRPYGLSPGQKLWKNIRSGAVFGKVMRRIRRGDEK